MILTSWKSTDFTVSKREVVCFARKKSVFALLINQLLSGTFTDILKGRVLEPCVLVAHSELTDQPNLMLFIQIPT